MDSTVFRFKRFEVSHGKGSMKVGVDAVLLGAWVDCNPLRILDAGTGCGVIALMLAQRYPEAIVEAIDIDPLSVEESDFNFKISPWSDRLKVWQAEFPKDLNGIKEKYDLIVSNPPYFQSGIKSPITRREIARHQHTLSVFSLLEHSSIFLQENGKLSMIFPIEFEQKVIEKAAIEGFNLKRICRVKDSKDKPWKRVMVELQRNVKHELKVEELTLFNDRIPTEAYKKLCKDFYLKF